MNRTHFVVRNVYHCQCHNCYSQCLRDRRVRVALGAVVMTGWLVTNQKGTDDLSAGAARRLSDVAVYRDAVADVLAELTAQDRRPSVAAAERVLARRLAEPEFASVLSVTPSGADAAKQRILRDVRSHRQLSSNSAGDVVDM